MTGLFPYSLDSLIACVEREIGMRERVYPRWVDSGRLSKDKSIKEIEMMKDVLNVLHNHIPALETLKGKTYYAKDSDGQWYFNNHGNAWVTCPPPFPKSYGPTVQLNEPEKMWIDPITPLDILDEKLVEIRHEKELIEKASRLKIFANEVIELVGDHQKLRNAFDLHRGDVCSLSNELENEREAHQLTEDERKRLEDKLDTLTNDYQNLTTRYHEVCAEIDDLTGSR